MSKWLRVFGVLGLALAAATPASAQVLQFYFYPDTAVTVVAGDSSKARLQIAGIPGGVGVNDYSVTLLLDGARVQVIQADAVGGANLPAPTITSFGDSVRLTASGTGVASSLVDLGDIWFRVVNGAVQGSLVSAKVNSMTSTTSTDLLPTHRTTVLNVCQANTYWGDVTGEHQITSRDALVALTRAVGLPTGGFDLSPGDVDADSVVTSRDALLILNHVIRLYTYSVRLGNPKTNRCAPLAPVPSDLLFYRSNQLWRVAGGDTLPATLNLPVAPYDVYHTTWSPDGQRVLYTQYTGAYYYEILSSTSPFVSVDTITRNGSGDFNADWSPDGRRIAFLSDRVSPPAVFKMDADGGGQTQLSNSTVTAITSQPVSFHPDGKRIAFVAYLSASCCQTGIWVTHADSSFAVQEEVLAGTAAQGPTEVSWNAAGDSIYYRNGANGQLYAVPYVPASPPATGVLVTRINGGHDYPAATSIGPAFRSAAAYPYDFFVRRATDGRHLRIVRGTSAGEYRPSFRRNSVYIQSVSVSPNPVTVALSGTAALTATVTNSDASANSTVQVAWISRDPSRVSVTVSGAQTANIGGVATTTGVYVVASVGGWRKDSTLVTVP